MVRGMDTKPPAVRESVRPRKHNLERDAAGGAVGAIAGASLGMVAGPPGAIAGAVIGGIVGAVATAVASERNAEDDARDRQTDLDIGVTSDELGAPNLAHPPAIVGTYSAAAAGEASESDSDQTPAEGPMQEP
jgi:phage tail tape-measure protein